MISDSVLYVFIGVIAGITLALTGLLVTALTWAWADTLKQDAASGPVLPENAITLERLKGALTVGGTLVVVGALVALMALAAS